MKKIFSMGFAAIMAVGMFSTAMADSFYVSGSATHSGEGKSAFGADTIHGGNIGLGYDVSSWLAVEADYDYFGKVDGTALKAYTVWTVADSVFTKIGSVPVHAIVRVGYTGVQVGEGRVNNKGVAYGAGLGFGVSENVDIIVDYRFRDIDTDGSVDMSTAGLGVKYGF